MSGERRSSESGGLARQTASSALWNGAGSVAVQTIALVTYVALAWMLGPEHFGTVAMALSLVALGRLLGDLGLGPAITSGRLAGDLETLTAHWAVSAWGVCASALLFAAAPAAAQFYGVDAVRPVLMLAALLPAIDSAAAVPQALLQRAHRFDRLAIADASCQLGIAAGALLMAAADFGVYALIVPQLGFRSLRTLWLCDASPLRLRFAASPSLLRTRLAESGHVMGASATQYLYANADNVIVGRFFGAEDLGRYSFAYNTLARCLTTLSHAASMPVLASLGALRDQPERFDEAVVRAARTVARVSFPITLGGALLAPQLALVLLGPRWEGTGPLLRCFLLLAALQSIGALTGPVWLALGRHRLVFVWGLFSAPIAIAAFFAGALLGSVEWVATSFALVSFAITSPGAYQVTRRICRLPLRGLLPGLAIVLLDVACMAVAVGCAGALLEGVVTPVAQLALQIAVGAIVYALIFRLAHPAELDALTDLLPAPLETAIRRFARLPVDQTLPGMIHQRPPMRRH